MNSGEPGTAGQQEHRLVAAAGRSTGRRRANAYIGDPQENPPPVTAILSTRRGQPNSSLASSSTEPFPENSPTEPFPNFPTSINPTPSARPAIGYRSREPLPEFQFPPRNTSDNSNAGEGITVGASSSPTAPSTPSSPSSPSSPSLTSPSARGHRRSNAYSGPRSSSTPPSLPVQVNSSSTFNPQNSSQFPASSTLSSSSLTQSPAHHYPGSAFSGPGPSYTTPGPSTQANSSSTFNSTNPFQYPVHQSSALTGSAHNPGIVVPTITITSPEEVERQARLSPSSPAHRHRRSTETYQPPPANNGPSTPNPGVQNTPSHTPTTLATITEDDEEEA